MKLVKWFWLGKTVMALGAPMGTGLAKIRNQPSLRRVTINLVQISNLNIYNKGGVLMSLHGELFSGMEGDFIISTSMAPSPLPCEPLASKILNWGDLKARYR